MSSVCVILRVVTLFESPDEGSGLAHRRDRAHDPFAEVHARRGIRNTLTVILAIVLTFGGLLLMVHLTTPGGLDLDDRPDAEVVALADRMFLTEEGRTIFFDAEPRLRDGAEVERACGFTGPDRDDSDDDIAAAGCYGGFDSIVIFEPSDERLYGMMVTTAAHELLHAAYERLSATESAEVDALVEAEIARVPTDDPVHAQVAWSVGDRPENRGTELFAYLGSQITLDGGFAPELEAYYARYFSDRGALVGVFLSVEATFDGIIAELEQGRTELAALERGNADGWAEYRADLAWHAEATAVYNADVDAYNAMSPEQRAGMFAVPTEPGGAATPWGDALSARLGELDALREDLAVRQETLTASDAQAAELRARLDVLYLDTVALFDAADPGSS